MALHRRDYEAISKIIRELVLFREEVGVFLSNEEEQKLDRYITEVKVKLSNELADYFSGENPKFNRDRFLKSCGVR